MQHTDVDADVVVDLGVDAGIRLLIDAGLDADEVLVSEPRRGAAHLKDEWSYQVLPSLTKPAIPT